MYHHSTRPTPVTCALAGSLCTTGGLGIVARALHDFTRINISPPFDALAFLVAVFGAAGGGVWVGWLIIRNLRAVNAALRTENTELRAERDQLGEILLAVKEADAQGERNFVRLGKLIKMMEDQRANETTRQLAPVRSIKGGA